MAWDWGNAFSTFANSATEINRQREASRVARRTGDATAWTATGHRQDRNGAVIAGIGAAGVWPIVIGAGALGLALVAWSR